MRYSTWALRSILGLSVGHAAALPAAPLKPTPASLAQPSPRGLIGGVIDAVAHGAADGIDAVVTGLAGDVDDVVVVATAFASVLRNAKATATPTNIDQVSSAVSRIVSSYATTGVPALVENALELVTNGLCIQDFTGNVLDDTNPLSAQNGFNNTNLREARVPAHVYPQADHADAPYQQTEHALRGAIHIPDSFTYGASDLVPLILVPGTGTFGGANYGSNMIKLLQGGGVADIVWLNMPDALLNDIQWNAEFVAYAINYISAVTGKKVAVATWSQGSLDAGWAFQYWPSTRHKVTDLINYSSDYHGTVLAYLLNPDLPAIPSTPSVVQQEYNSTFINVFRSGGGASAYVPTTTIYSGFFDEIVEPEQGGPSASGYLNDDRHVGVSNNEVQSICSGQPAGSLYTHEGILYNPLAYALTIDAITHKGPGRPERLDLGKVCAKYATDGLSLPDVLATEANIPIAALNILLYHSKTFDEPVIKKYAQQAS